MTRRRRTQGLLSFFVSLLVLVASFASPEEERRRLRTTGTGTGSEDATLRILQAQDGDGAEKEDGLLGGAIFGFLGGVLGLLAGETESSAPSVVPTYAATPYPTPLPSQAPTPPTIPISQEATPITNYTESHALNGNGTDPFNASESVLMATAVPTRETALTSSSTHGHGTVWFED